MRCKINKVIRKSQQGSPGRILLPSPAPERLIEGMLIHRFTPDNEIRNEKVMYKKGAAGFNHLILSVKERPSGESALFIFKNWNS
ncbi:MAG: hypothetical protein WBK43_00850 [Prolixibacteraceae bacterium]|nr:hypothetical protein [Prolixibacteraceae bacterium]MDI9564436.1 hypothetical protein [Bacteroidota bacterium]NLT00815.1 hypothetical protein [Bacteroidales bacterium]HNU78334.1 hypothetical protein [Prolixibacteraceae bacterium]HNZ68397.1 hypothetical protein [Prolixibacteraceae bacterium]